MHCLLFFLLVGDTHLKIFYNLHLMYLLCTYSLSSYYYFSLTGLLTFKAIFQSCVWFVSRRSLGPFTTSYLLHYWLIQVLLLYKACSLQPHMDEKTRMAYCNCMWMDKKKLHVFINWVIKEAQITDTEQMLKGSYHIKAITCLPKSDQCPAVFPFLHAS